MLKMSNGISLRTWHFLIGLKKLQQTTYMYSTNWEIFERILRSEFDPFVNQQKNCLQRTVLRADVHVCPSSTRKQQQPSNTFNKLKQPAPPRLRDTETCHLGCQPLEIPTLERWKALEKHLTGKQAAASEQFFFNLKLVASTTIFCLKLLAINGMISNLCLRSAWKSTHIHPST